MNKIKFIKNNYDVLIPAIFLLLCYFIPYFYGLQILLIFIFPIVIRFYKKKFHIVKYRVYNPKTKYNFIAFWIVLLVSIFLPMTSHDIVMDTYQNNIRFNCLLLKKYDNEYMIDNYKYWALTPTSMPNLVQKIDSCHLKDKKQFLSYLLFNPKDGYNLLDSHKDTFFYNPVAIPIKHALINLYHQPLPVFESAFPDNKNGYYNPDLNLQLIKHEINDLK